MRDEVDTQYALSFAVNYGAQHAFGKQALIALPAGAGNLLRGGEMTGTDVFGDQT